MPTPILATKLFIPPPRRKAVHRARLITRLNDGIHHKLTLISAPAGFGKTTVLSEWVASSGRRVAWLSLDENDNDPVRFLTYLVGALQTIAPQLGEGIMTALQSPQPPPVEPLLATLLNEMMTISEPFILILDDYHVVEVDHLLAFLLDHLPPHIHLVIVTREDPQLPLARLRTRGQMTELRAADLRFTPEEAAEFFNQVMALDLSAENITALETRTEGWIAGLQLAALSMQGQKDISQFIQSFTGSHRFVLDYLVEEVLQQQPENIQTFLLHTSILDRLCGSLCDAVLLTTSGQETLQALERANLFIVPLDNERHWYRYHHLFAELLRQQVRQHNDNLAGYHIRASAWYERHDFVIEAFHHAVAANDIDRAMSLIDRIPLHFRGAVNSVIDWLASLPKTVLNARPFLWVRCATLMLVVGQTTGVEEKLQAGESVLQGDDEQTRNLIGQIATARATLALTRYQLQAVIVQSQRALDYLPPDNVHFHASANWALGAAYGILGNRTAARDAFNASITLSEDSFTTILATIGLGQVQEAENQLHQAAETYQRVLQLAGHQPLQIIYEAHLGLAHIYYEWNDLDAAQEHGQQALQLAQQYDRVIDRSVVCELFLVRLKLAQNDLSGAASILRKVDQFVRQHNFVHRIPEVAATQVLVLLNQGNVTAAAELAESHDLLLSQARVYLAQGKPSSALPILATLRQQAEEKNLQDERLKVMVLQALSKKQALAEVLALAEPGGFIRLFVDEGLPMKQLLQPATPTNYVQRLLAAFPHELLSERELEVLRCIADGFTNNDIADRLYLSINTVKVHARNIMSKLDASNRTQAVARARELGLLHPPE